MSCDFFEETELKLIFSYITFANNLVFYAFKLRVIIHTMQAKLFYRWLAILSISCTHLGRFNVLIGKTASHVKLFQVGCKENEIQEKEYKKGKEIALQAWTGPEGSRKLRFPDFKTIGT
jgi:hypothetical protein